MPFVVLGFLGLTLAVLIPLAVGQRRARLAPMVRERQLAFAELAMEEIPDPPRAQASRLPRPFAPSRSDARQLSIGQIAVGVWLGIWLFVLSVAIPAGCILLALWRRAGGRW